MTEERQFEICPKCNADLATESNLMYVEVGTTNYIMYKKDPKLGWIEDYEDDGNNPEEVYYACRGCQQKLPMEYQEYYSERV